MPDSDPDLPPQDPPPGEAAPPPPPADATPPLPPEPITQTYLPATIKPVPPPTDEVGFRGLFGGRSEGEEESPPSEELPGRRSRKKLRSEMGFFEHLEELRMTIIKSAFAAAVGMGIMSLFFIKFFDFLRYPLELATGGDPAKAELISINPLGVIIMVIQVSIYGGAMLALPLIAYFVVQFIAPGLTLREKGMLRPALVAALVLFLIGMMTCFFIMLPAGLRFNIMLSEKLGIKNTINVPDYYSLVVKSTLSVGAAFEFPLILVILQVLGILAPETLRSSRRYAVIIIAIIGGLLAPSPDVSSMLMMMVPMLLLYEASIIVGSRLRKRRLAAQAREAAKGAG